MITQNIEQAIEALNKNEIVAIPTETVYGLAGNAFQEVAIQKIYSLKKRPFHNPLIVHISSIYDLSLVAKDIPEIALKLAEHFWPGPLTLVLPKTSNIPDIVTAGKNTVAVRIPQHPMALKLLSQLDYPLAAPSANPFGSISPTKALHVEKYFHQHLDVILDGGDCHAGIESTILGFKNNQVIVYRQGSIPLEEIEKITGPLIYNTLNNETPDAPGMLTKHYAPSAETYLTNNVSEMMKLFPDKNIGLLLFTQKIQGPNIIHRETLSLTQNLREAAANLYAALHRLDQYQPDVIIAERLPDQGLGKAINDKLTRAAAK